MIAIKCKARDLSERVETATRQELERQREQLWRDIHRKKNEITVIELQLGLLVDASEPGDPYQTTILRSDND